MKLEGLPLSKKSQLEIARGQYNGWVNKRKTSKIYLAVLFAMCEGVCPVCGVDMILGFNNQLRSLPNSATLDHITPLAVVKVHKKYGLQIMCKLCNNQKGKT